MIATKYSWLMMACSMLLTDQTTLASFTSPPVMVLVHSNESNNRLLQAGTTNDTIFAGQPQCDASNTTVADFGSDFEKFIFATPFRPTCSCEEVPYNGAQVLSGIDNVPTNTSTAVEAEIFLAQYNAVFDQLEYYVAFECQNACEICYNDYCGIYNETYLFNQQGGEGNWTVNRYPVDLYVGDFVSTTAEYLQLFNFSLDYCFHYTKGQTGTICSKSSWFVDKRTENNLRVLNCTVTYNDQPCNSCALFDKSLNSSSPEYCFVGDCSNLAEDNGLDEILNWNLCLNQDTSVFRGRFSALENIMATEVSSNVGKLGRCDFPPTPTPSTAPSPTTINNNNNKNNVNNSNKAPVAVIAGVVGAVVTLLLLAGVCFMFQKRTQVNNSKQTGAQEILSEEETPTARRDDDVENETDHGTDLPPGPQPAVVERSSNVTLQTHTASRDSNHPAILPEFKDQARSWRGRSSDGNGNHVLVATAVAVEVPATDEASEFSARRHVRLEP